MMRLRGKHALPWRDEQRARRKPWVDSPWFSFTLTAFGIIVAAIIVVVMLATGYAAIAIFLALWYLAYRILRDADAAPWDYSRFFSALLVAWVADPLLFRFLTGVEKEFHHRYAGLSSAVLVLSVAIGYYFWREFALSRTGEEHRDSGKVDRDSGALMDVLTNALSGAVW